jgi:hypothetical protein
MNRAIIAAVRDKLGTSQRVINALNASDTDSYDKVSTVDTRVRMAGTVLELAADTIVLNDGTSTETAQVHRVDGFVDVWCYGRTRYQAMRIRDAVRREFNDFGQGYLVVSPSVGRVTYQHYSGDGSLVWLQPEQLYEAQGTISFSMFMAT